MKKLLTTFIAFSLCITSFSQKDTTLALTPPMGWNSWNTFATDIHEDLVMGIIDSIVSKGLAHAGYTYVVLDDGWMAKERDSNGNLVADSIKFPHGMKFLVDYAHNKGLKFGLYNCAGTHTCGGYPGSRGHEYQDALLYASWGIDFLKYDWCYTDDLNAKEAYITMRDAIANTGRSMVFSICEWGDNQPWEWATHVGHMWRTSGDITPCFDCENDHGTWSSWGFMKIAFMRDSIRKYAGPGHWNDYDMMEVGNGMTYTEDKSHFALWSMLNSPLILGNDVRSASQQTINLLTNKYIISINQDSLGIPAFLYSSKDSIDVWVKPLRNKKWAICIINKSNSEKQINFFQNKHSISDPIYNYNMEYSFEETSIFDCFTMATFKNKQTSLASHDVILVTVQTKK